MIADVINGLFEACAGVVILLNIYRVRKDKKVTGVSIVPAFFFTVWGFWNLYYSPSLIQWASFFGGLLVIAGNAVWVSLAVYYGRRRRAGR